MSVAKSIEIHAQGDTLEDATEAAVHEASKTVSNIKNVYVDAYQAIVEDGEIQTYRVHTKVTFVIRE
jgi:flavin-binding protein dodecin